MKKGTKTRIVKELEILAMLPTPLTEQETENDANEAVQASKHDDPEIPKEMCEKPQKPKRIPTEAQKEAMARGRETIAKNREAKRLAKEAEEQQKKKELESKIVQKAISIKKKEMKASLLLDEISDDETPIEEIKAKIKAKASAPAPVKAVQKQPQQKEAPPPSPRPVPTTPRFIFV